MLIRVLAALAGIGFIVAVGAPAVAADTDGPKALCIGDPYAPIVEFVCGKVSVALVPDAEIEVVVARSAPSATIVGQESTGTWHLSVPPGQEATVRDALREDPAVDYVSLWYVGDLSGAGGLPDTAMTPGDLRLTALVGLLMAGAAILSAGRELAAPQNRLQRLATLRTWLGRPEVRRASRRLRSEVTPGRRPT